MQPKPSAAPSSLMRRAYRTLLKEAAYFDGHPLAKALLSASPYLRKDLSWMSVVNQPPACPTSVTAFCGVPANTLAIPTPTSMRQFVQGEFRHPERQWDGVRFFAWMRRLELAKVLHEKCSVSIPPALPPVRPKLQLVTEMQTDGAGCAPGMLLLAHPVLVDDFTQAVVFVVNTKAGRTTGLTLNAPCGPASFLLDEKRLAHIGVTRKAIRPANTKFFGDWPIFTGGPISSPPVLLHRSEKLLQRLRSAPRKTSKMAEDPLPLPHGPVAGGWIVSPLAAVLAVDPKLLKAELHPERCRIVMNYGEWDTQHLQTEVLQNWWLATEPQSSCEALESLLAYPCAAEAGDEGSGKVMWQRAVGNLGGDLSDFSRLTIIEEEDGGYRKLITDTFREDLKRAHAKG